MNREIELLASKHALYVDGTKDSTMYMFTKESLDAFVGEVVRVGWKEDPLDRTIRPKMWDMLTGKRK